MARKRDVSLVALGVVVHSIYMLSIFDIYFKTPIVHGMDPVVPRTAPPAKRLVLFIADGLRADKFYEWENESQPRAPFLHSIAKFQGRWGVSHARPPTESRPGHVAIIAGFYEDPSAVTKGWKANPVEFDSVFNRSRLTVSYGSPDIVPIFCGGLTNSLYETYSHEYEDFAADASFLDQWSFDKFADMLNKSRGDAGLRASLDGDKLVIFLHLLGFDTNGHAHRPYSSIYLDNVKLVDRGVQSTVKLMDEYFADGRTAYVFTADHGMSNKGSHGDGDPDCTQTPLVAWGSGVSGPRRVEPHDGVDDGFDMQTPAAWGMDKVARADVNQADIAPLMTTLLGLPCPMNSVGILPTDYLDFDPVDALGLALTILQSAPSEGFGEGCLAALTSMNRCTMVDTLQNMFDYFEHRLSEKAEAVFANAKQILNQVLRKAELKEKTSLYFKPYAPLTGYRNVLEKIEALIDRGQFDAAIQSGQELIALSLKGIHYFQTYDWLFLMTTVIVGFAGWMLYILMHVLKSYTSFGLRRNSKEISRNSVATKYNVRIAGAILMGALSILLLIERSPPLYHAYLGLACFFWTEILGDRSSFLQALSALSSIKLSGLAKLLTLAMLTFFTLELLVLSFFRREVYTGIFLVAGVIGAVVLSRDTPSLSVVPAFVWAACWSLSTFTLMPIQIPDSTQLVVGSGFIVIALAFAARWLDSTAPKILLWKPLVFGPARKSDKSGYLFTIQIVLVVVANVMVWTTTSHRESKRSLPGMYQILNWSIAGTSILLPLKSPRSILTRLSSIFLGFAPPFLLLSIGYEGLFYSALAAVLLAWVIVETAALSPDSVPARDRSGSTPLSDVDNKRAAQKSRLLTLADVRVAVCFLILINVAFFGTGNVASVASFEISSVYRFITIFNPVIMGLLLLIKVFVPFVLVTSAFSAVTYVLALPRLGCYFIVLLLSDVMTIHFFFLVRTTGSWLDIGQTISHFGIMSAQVVFVLILFAITGIYTNDLEISSQQATCESTVGSKDK